MKLKSTFKLIKNVGNEERVTIAKDVNSLFDSIALPVDKRTLRKSNRSAAYTPLTDEQNRNRKAWRSVQIYVDKLLPTHEHTQCIVLTNRIDEHTVEYIAKTQIGPQWRDITSDINDAVLFTSEDKLTQFASTFANLVENIDVDCNVSVKSVTRKGEVSVKIIKERKPKSTTTEETNE